MTLRILGRFRGCLVLFLCPESGISQKIDRVEYTVLFLLSLSFHKCQRHRIIENLLARIYAVCDEKVFIGFIYEYSKSLLVHLEKKIYLFVVIKITFIYYNKKIAIIMYAAFKF